MTNDKRAQAAIDELDSSGRIIRELQAGTPENQRIAKMLWFLAGLVGLRADEPEFFDQVFPNDTPFNRRDFAKKETCGTVCEAALRVAGVDDPWLRMPYADSITGGRPPAVVCQRQIAQKNGAWVASNGQNSPNVGDMVEITNQVHVLTTWTLVSDGVSGKQGTLKSIDGGQTSVDVQVMPRVRAWEWEDNGASYTDTTRKITGWINMRKLLQSQAANT